MVVLPHHSDLHHRLIPVSSPYSSDSVSQLSMDFVSSSQKFLLWAMVLMWNEFHERHCHCIVRQTLINWGTGKNTEKRTFPFTDQIPCGCKLLCQQSLTHTFFWDTGEECRRKGPNFKAKENGIWYTTKTSVVEKIVFFFVLPENMF